MAEIRLSVSHKIDIGGVSKSRKNPPMKHELEVKQFIEFPYGSSVTGNYNDPGYPDNSSLSAAHSFGIGPPILPYRTGDGKGLAYNLKCLNIAKMVVNREKFSALKHSNGVDLIYPDITGTYILGFAKGTGPFSGNGSPYSEYATFSFESTTGSDIQTWAETTPIDPLPGAPFILEPGEMTFTGGPLKDSDILVTYNVPGVPNLRKIVQTGSYFLTYVDRDSGDLINVGSIEDVTFRSAFVFQSQHTDHDTTGINTYHKHNSGDYYYPLIDSLSAIMKWYQDLNTFHGWGLPPFKIINVNGVANNFTPTDCTTVLNIEDYELFGEPWHFENTLYQIIDWLKLLGKILGVNYWQDLIYWDYSRVVPTVEITDDKFFDAIHKGKYSGSEYYKLFPVLTPVPPQAGLGFRQVKMVRLKLLKNSIHGATHKTNVSNFAISGVRKEGGPPVGIKEFKFVKLVNGVIISVSSTWIPFSGMTKPSIMSGLSDIGYTATDVHQRFKFGGTQEISEFLVEFDTDYVAGVDPLPYIVGKYPTQAEPITLQHHKDLQPFAGFTFIARGEINLRTIFDASTYYYINNQQQYSYGANAHEYLVHYPGGYTSFPNESVHIKTFLANGNSILKRYGLKGTATCKVKKYPATVNRNTPDIFNVEGCITISFYVGKTDEFSTLFSPRQKGSGLIYSTYPEFLAPQTEDEVVYDKIKSVLEGGTKVFEVLYDSDVSTIDLDFSEFLTYEDGISFFMGVVVEFDESKLDAIDIPECIRSQWNSGVFPTGSGLGYTYYMEHKREKYFEGIDKPEFYIDFGYGNLYLTLDGPAYKVG